MDELVANGVIEVFGLNLREMREERGWSQSELARQMQGIGWSKYSQVAVSRTEEGTRAVRLDEAIDLAGLMDATVGELISPPSSRAGQIFELQRQGQAVAAAAAELNAAAKHYESVRAHAEAILRQTERYVQLNPGVKSLTTALEDEIRSLTEIVKMDAFDLLEWVEDKIDEEEADWHSGKH